MRPHVEALLLAALLTGATPEDDPIEALVRDLDADSIETRSDAAAALLRIGKEALPGVDRALAGTPSPEARCRLEELSFLLRLPPGGAVVDGLRLELSVENPDVHPGEPLWLRIGIRNLSGVERAVQVGWGPRGVAFEIGEGFEVRTPGAVSRTRVTHPMFVCGNKGQQNLFVGIPGRGVKRFRVRAEYRDGAWVFGDDALLHARADGVQRFRYVHSVIERNRSYSRHDHFTSWCGERPTPERVAGWSGLLESNDVDVRVLLPARGR